MSRRSDAAPRSCTALLDRIGLDHVQPEDIKQVLQSQKFAIAEKKALLQPLRDNNDRLVAEMRVRVGVAEGQEDQRVKRFTDLMAKMPSLRSSSITTKMLGDYVFDFATLFKHVKESSSTGRLLQDSALNHMEPLITTYSKAKSIALEQKCS